MKNTKRIKKNKTGERFLHKYVVQKSTGQCLSILNAERFDWGSIDCECCDKYFLDVWGWQSAFPTVDLMYCEGHLWKKTNEPGDMPEWERSTQYDVTEFDELQVTR